MYMYNIYIYICIHIFQYTLFHCVDQGRTLGQVACAAMAALFAARAFSAFAVGQVPKALRRLEMFGIVRSSGAMVTCFCLFVRHSRHPALQSKSKA